MLAPCARSGTSIASAKTSRPFSMTIRPRKAMTSSSSSMPSPRRQSMSRRSGLNCSRSTPRVQIEMSRFIRWARSTAAIEFGRSKDRVAAPVDSAHDRADERLERLQVVVIEIGVEPGVDRCDGGDLAAARPADRAMRDDVGRGDVNHVGREIREVAAHAAASAPSGRRYSSPRRAQATTGMLTSSPVGSNAGVSDRRRIDAHLRALAQQISDEPVQRLVGAVPHIIVIARKQGDAKLVRLHGQCT